MIQMSGVILDLQHTRCSVHVEWFKSIGADGDLASQDDLNLLLFALNVFAEYATVKKQVEY